jgi:hypothetical protein
MSKSPDVHMSMSMAKDTELEIWIYGHMDLRIHAHMEIWTFRHADIRTCYRDAGYD